MKRIVMTTLVRHAVRSDRVGVVIAALVEGSETFRFQVLTVSDNGQTSLDLERVGNREYVMDEFQYFLDATIPLHTEELNPEYEHTEQEEDDHAFDHLRHAELLQRNQDRERNAGIERIKRADRERNQ